MDWLERAAEVEQLDRDIALAAQHERAGLDGKTAADSAEFCELPDCGAPIPDKRRQAVPGCRFCVECQERIEKYPAWGERYA
ncbi:TraR/DksA C4-type zinc finger protein [Methylogaea oryzae]|uniref:Zinc finger DksA/TraR C4-type domain-containing protein n=1 Tax=Methylogaea oryzae TaxID=1295382 RepID=A0A8D4VKX4_9GAMM|nr:TraR/DksA C4-type zinc finger protein [Methylogaea oryzae]BBL69738.1 hypothetical protein MoryE10_03440 [Methylogaea oryzae]